MSAHPGPTLRRHQLGRILNRLRIESGVSVAEAASTLGCSEPRIYHLEAGRNIPKKPEQSELLRLYQAPELIESLELIRVEANQRGWWSPYGLPAWLQTYIGLESSAETVRCFALEGVPGLLQTEEYARACFELHNTPEHEIKKHVAVRMHRQSRLGDGQVVHAVLSEGLLHRAVNMGRVGVEQLTRLAETDRPGVSVQVLPFRVGMHRGLAGNFTLLSFPDEVIKPVAYWDNQLSTDTSDATNLVDHLAAVFDDLCGKALSCSETERFIAEFTHGRS